LFDTKKTAKKAKRSSAIESCSWRIEPELDSIQ
jgi:hypothetical protein